MTYTTGPWESGHPNDQTIMVGGKDIASVYCSDKHWRGNARLIAAAPDLLAAVEFLTEHMEGMCITYGMDPEAYISGYKDLIAMARGEL